MLAFAHGRDRNRRMPMIRSGHVNGVQVRLFLQQLAEIHVSGAALVRLRPVARTVVRFDESLSGLAPADAQAGRKALRKLNRPGGSPIFSPILEPGSQQPPRGGEHSVGVIFGVLLTALI